LERLRRVACPQTTSPTPTRADLTRIDSPDFHEHKIALKALNTTAQGNALGPAIVQRNKPCKGVTMAVRR